MCIRDRFYSVVTEDNIQPNAETVRTDETGEYATYTDEKVLVTEGKTGMRSQLWRESYDWDTNELVDSVQISSDYYSPVSYTHLDVYKRQHYSIAAFFRQRLLSKMR